MARRIAGILLILGSALFLIGVSRPVVGQVFNAVAVDDVPTQIEAVAASPGEWRFANLMMGVSTSFSALGLVVLAAIIRRISPSRQLVSVGFIAAAAMAVAALAFLLICLNRVTLPPEILAKNHQDIPGWAQTSYTLGISSGILLLGYIPLRSRYSKWGGGGVILTEVGLLALSYTTFREIIPAIHYLPLTIGGIALLFSQSESQGFVSATKDTVPAESFRLV